MLYSPANGTTRRSARGYPRPGCKIKTSPIPIVKEKNRKAARD
jgi:hypothetical protein